MLTLPLRPVRKPPGPLLGVEKSARGFAWFDRLAPEQAPLAAAICQRHNLHELVGRIFASRGAQLDEVPGLLSPTLKQLMPAPGSLLDMEKGAERLADAIMRRETIAIFGDYDVDGACSSALMSLFLDAHDVRGRIYIPDRMTEGYGPNPAAITALIDDGAQLIITVDCGTTSHEPLAVASARGVPVIVVDHHQATETLPDAHAVINPNRQDDLSGQGHLSAAGVVFLLLAATVRRLRLKGAYAQSEEPNLLKWLDLVALSTVCDVVPLQGVNRAFVAQGLKVMRHRHNPGLTALADVASLKSAPTPYHLGFVLGPRINAGGRIGDASLGARLLATADTAEAARIAAVLDRLNRERQDMEAQMLKDARAEAEAQIERNPDTAILVVASSAYHKGIVGLLASRLTDQFQRPSLVIAWDDQRGEGTGSGRSVVSADIGRAVHAALDAGLIKKGGGHAMAAGVTLDKPALADLKLFLEAQLTRSAASLQVAARFEVDGVVTAAGANHALFEQIEKAGPFGQGNPNPRFVLPAHKVAFLKEAGSAHLRCRLSAADGAAIDAIAFRAGGTPLGDALAAARGKALHVAGRLTRNSWGGRDSIELMIEDIADPAACSRT